MLLTGDIFCFFYYIKEVRNQEWIVEGNRHPHKGYIEKMDKTVALLKRFKSG